MSELEKITKEVRPTSLDIKETPTEISLEEINSKIITFLDTQQTDLYKMGQAKQGKKLSNSISIIKDALLKEIEDLELVKGDNTDRIINTVTKKTLQQQTDNIIKILEMSLKQTENKYFLLGLIIKSIFNK